MKPTIKSTLSLIKKAHAGQMYGSSPYWTHPLAVAEKGREIFGSKFTDTAYIVALLHDVIEDTHLTLTDLQKMGYSAQVLDAVSLVTKDKSMDYVFAQMVKFADNFINYTGDKSHWDSKRAEKSQAKYMKSMKTIGSVLNVDPMKHLS
jgi:(p)ppGpp synthase/HD superfamily hydrolase